MDMVFILFIIFLQLKYVQVISVDMGTWIPKKYGDKNKVVDRACAGSGTYTVYNTLLGPLPSLVIPLYLHHHIGKSSI